MTSRYASVTYCRDLYIALGRPVIKMVDFPNFWLIGQNGKSLGLVSEVDHMLKYKELLPAYDLSWLLELALATGHQRVTIKKSPRGVIVTAPPCYHVEARTAPNAIARFLTQSARRKFVLTKLPKKVAQDA